VLLSLQKISRYCCDDIVLLVFTVESEAVPIHLHGGNLVEAMPATENSKAEHENNKINKVQDPGLQLIIHSMPFWLMPCLTARNLAYNSSSPGQLFSSFAPLLDILPAPLPHSIQDPRP
jgi:hypothetical protein